MKSLPVRAATALLFALLLPLGAGAQISVSVAFAPPPLPVYAQPVAPGDGYIWMPGYWVWSPNESDYYWVPATWVLAPNAGDLWTPGYWAFEDSAYFWHGGYWGNTVGYYGGVNYGYGYSGTGYQGGRWDHGSFLYNRAVSHIDPSRETHSYSARVVDRAPNSHVSYNGGPAGTHAQPTAAQRKEGVGEHAGPTAEQTQHEHQAVAMPTQRASVSHGAPPVAATPRPSAFNEPGAERTRPAQDAQRQTMVARPAAAPRPQAEPRAEAPAPRPQPERAAPRPEPRAAPQERGESRPEEPRR